MNDILPRTGLAIQWIGDPRDLRPLYGEWQDLADRSGADIYLSPAWFDVWWRHFSHDRRLVCLVARENGVLAGLLPFCTETIRVGPLAFRIARLAGTDPHCMIFKFPLDATRATDILEAALNHLLLVRHCDAVSFTPVSELAGHRILLQSLCLNNPGFSLTDAPESSHIVFDLPDRFESFLDGISQKRRSQFRRDIKGLHNLFSMTAHRSAPDSAAFAEFVAFHNLQWQAVNKGGHFTDWPGSADFYRDLADQTTVGGQVQLFTLRSTAGPLTGQFALVASKTAHWRLPARSLDPEADRLSAGKVGLLLMIEQLIGDGVTRIEAGRGAYDYKLSYGGTAVPVHRMLVIPATTAGRRRVKAVLAWADVLNLVYYRAWFLKFAPKLRQVTGQKPRALWRSWIRSRL